MITCGKCGAKLEATEVDEYTPRDYKEGLAIPYENLPEDKEIHVWMDIGNLFMHFKEGEASE